MEMCYLFNLTKNYAVLLASHQNKMPSFSKMYFPSLLLVFKAWLCQYPSTPLSTPGSAQLSVTLENCQKTLGTDSDRLWKGWLD